MNKLMISLMLVVVGTFHVAAQDATTIIRKHYAEAQQKVAEYSKGENDDYSSVFPQYYEVNIMQNLPGTGPHHEQMRLYFYEHELGEDGEPDGPMLARSLQFVTYKYNFAAREFYEEYLYDEKGNVEFVYMRNVDMYDGKGGECRMYFKSGRMFKVMLSACNLQTEKYEPSFSGSSMPNDNAELYDHGVYMVGKFKRLFDELDRDTFH